MELTLTLHRDELTQALRDFLPMRLTLGKREATDDPAWVQVDALDSVSFLPGHGIALTCAAHLHYPLPVLPDNFTVQHVSLRMIPQIMGYSLPDESPLAIVEGRLVDDEPSVIVEGQGDAVLAFTLAVDELEIKYLPEFVDQLVADKINAALRDHATTIAWDYSRLLRRVVNLPQRFGLVRAIELISPQGQVQVTDDAIVVTIALDVCFHHAAEEAGEPCPTRS